uniref:NADH-ubiquinone oxidoreductase chain 4L n=2 Tax=Galaxea TaxID=46744 RepID=A0AA51NPQ8_9CNID|nr:NADH dehydrogenase subunit 4L [Galaxea fascicularis]YP_010953617.1 NADH dehydrogenase subunit 4L [Galaxea astreata]YP_010953630.1 NADH dehydrogenase subunit 4L [Galaxea paucisepta]AML60333.1 NADH dehydrogenase subunit 4L [Galaxea fascicularis]WMQ77789.1 NADH dehydrogenase subunit 4L [Galaxea astreata]WMQ77802.1 NADH dehydrogenase subunit 4L [Galaxea astreata]WMQ77815.1 NADH dehydrogenase subunit 4L [Galaxea paucisepta]WMQ77828.1 NADH dehydrogenase subunit 4L [Galaxea paucisepta]
MYYKYVIVIVILLLLGGWGVVLNRGHFIIMIISIELILLAAFFLFLISSIEIDLLIEQVFTIMGLTVAAAESAIGLAIMVAYYRIRGTIILKSFSSLRG